MRRAVGAAASALALVALVAVYSSTGAAAPRQLHTGAHPHPESHCVDVWDNEWCKSQKGLGKCVDNYVLTKCLGTCGSCCLDEGTEDPEELAQLEKGEEFCDKVHQAGQCFKHSSKCMHTCGVCDIDAKLDCSFESGGREDDFCFYQKSYNPGTAEDFVSVSTFNDKRWTGPRRASHEMKFAHLDSEISKENDCVYLTSPWGHIEAGSVLVFDYNMYSRDYPQAMGRMQLDVLPDREDEGWVEVWVSEGTSRECGAGWTQTFADVGSALGESGIARVRYHIKAGNDALSDMGVDNVRVEARVCGDGKRVFEHCDDGNARGGDGCSAECEIEEGWRCVPTESGQDQCSRLRCGDGVVSGDEECDDGNLGRGDGCHQCKVEKSLGFHCQTEPVPCLDPCKPAIGQDVLHPGPSVCFPVYPFMPRLVNLQGGPAETGETDGEPWTQGVLTIYEEHDGVGSFKGVCPSEENWKLAQVACFEQGYAVGLMAKPDDEVEWLNGGECGPWGRGTLDHGFLCDETSRMVADCDTCAATCEHAAIVRCEYSGLCGDGFRRHSLEVCDDGNTEDGDGCSADCQVETGWHCHGGSWNSKDTCEFPVCGDGFRTANEQCDDGQTCTVTGTGRQRVETCEAHDGDGCSKACEVEEGWFCDYGSPTSMDKCWRVGDIRLMPQPEAPAAPRTFGTLEVMAEDGWGTVCAHGYDLKDANNACERVGAKYSGGKAMWVQTVEALPRDTRWDPPVKFSGGCCQLGMPTEGMLYRCGVDEEATHDKCHLCEDVVHLTCSDEP